MNSSCAPLCGDARRLGESSIVIVTDGERASDNSGRAMGSFDI